MPCTMTGRHNTKKISTLSKWMYRFSAISIKIKGGFFSETDSQFPNLCEIWGAKNGQDNSEKKTLVLIDGEIHATNVTFLNSQ